MASLYSATSLSPFSSSRSPLLKKSSSYRPFCASYPCSLNQLSHGGIGRSIYHQSLRNRTSPPSLKVNCVHDFRTPSKVTRQSWDKLVLGSETPVLVEFYASWCGPCQMVHRVINDIALEYNGKLNCFTLNADGDPEVAENYDIKAVPVVLIFKNGEKRESIVGTMPKEFYVAAIEKVLKT